MSVGHNVKFLVVALSVTFGAATGAYSEDAVKAQPAAFSQAAAPEAAPAAKLADAVAVPSNDGLHSDKRWPQMADCINNTASQDQFVSCLRTAFLADGTGAEVALLQR